MKRELTIQGFDTRLGARGLYVRFTLNGKDRHRPLGDVFDWCDRELYGLSKADRDAFRAAHDRYLVELEQGRPLPFPGPIRRL